MLALFPLFRLALWLKKIICLADNKKLYLGRRSTRNCDHNLSFPVPVFIFHNVVSKYSTFGCCFPSLFSFTPRYRKVGFVTVNEFYVHKKILKRMAKKSSAKWSRVHYYWSLFQMIFFDLFSSMRLWRVGHEKTDAIGSVNITWICEPMAVAKTQANSSAICCWMSIVAVFLLCFDRVCWV